MSASNTTPPDDLSVAPTLKPGLPREQAKIVSATVIGTAVEWYDFFVYALAAGMVFSKIFFEPAGPGMATVLAFLTVGISFLFRPLGAFLAGHFGDKLGRRAVLVTTMVLMGVATTLVGVLPTYAQAGIIAPILLILVRITQGLAAGGQWGGAVLMAVEHAPHKQRGLFGAGPQIGVPLGLVMASATLGVMNVIAPGDAFFAWGWRVPFLLSIVLVIVAHLVRHGVSESPVFLEISERAEQTKAPAMRLIRNHWQIVLVGALVFAGNGAVGYMVTGGFIQNYASDPAGPIALDRGVVLLSVSIAGLWWVVTTVLAGWASDKIGRIRTYVIGWVLQGAAIVVLFPLVNTGNVVLMTLALCFLTTGTGFTYGPQPALYAEIFPAAIRFSGVSITYALGSILGGAFAPTIAQALIQATGTTTSIAIYLGGATLVGFIATILIRDRSWMPLGIDHEELQEQSPFRFSKEPERRPAPESTATPVV